MNPGTKNTHRIIKIFRLFWSCVKIFVDTFKGDKLEEVTDSYHCVGATSTNELDVEGSFGFVFNRNDLILLATRFKNLKKLHFTGFRLLIPQS